MKKNLYKIIFFIFLLCFPVFLASGETLKEIINKTIRFDDWQGAKSRLEKYIQDNPYDVEAFILYAEVLSTLNLHDDAILAMRKALTFEKDSLQRSYLYYNLGNYYLMKDINNTALEMFKKSVELNPGFDSPYKQMGLIYYKDENYKELLKSWKNYVKVTTDENKKEKINRLITIIEGELEKIEEEKRLREEFIKQIVSEIENIETDSKSLEADTNKTQSSDEDFEEID